MKRIETVSGMVLTEVLTTIKRETEPEPGHPDPNAVNDIWEEVFETVKILEKNLFSGASFEEKIVLRESLDNQIKTYEERIKEIESEMEGLCDCANEYQVLLSNRRTAIEDQRRAKKMRETL